MGFVRLLWRRNSSGEVLASIGSLANGQVTAGVVRRMSGVSHYPSPKWWNVSPLHFRPESPDFWRNCRSQLCDSRNSGLTRQIRV